jgi:hypothetical protein
MRPEETRLSFLGDPGELEEALIEVYGIRQEEKKHDIYENPRTSPVSASNLHEPICLISDFQGQFPNLF